MLFQNKYGTFSMKYMEVDQKFKLIKPQLKKRMIERIYIQIIYHSHYHNVIQIIRNP